MGHKKLGTAAIISCMKYIRSTHTMSTYVVNLAIGRISLKSCISGVKKETLHKEWIKKLLPLNIYEKEFCSRMWEQNAIIDGMYDSLFYGSCNIIDTST